MPDLAGPASVRPRRPRGRVQAYVTLTKPRVMELLLLTTAPTMVLARGGLPDLASIGITLVGGAASSGSAAVFNMYLDRDLDAQMNRTRNRPIVTGEVSPRAALIFAWVLAVFSTAWFALLVNPLASALSIMAIVWYVVIYTVILKRRTVQNIVWGGLAGCFPVVIAWASETNSVGAPALVLFLVVFFWTPAHYWPLSVRYADDYRRAGVPMLGAVRTPVQVASSVLGYAVATVACALALIPVAGMGAVYSTAATLGGCWFVWHAWRYRSATKSDKAENARPMRVFAASNVYLAILFMAVAMDTLVRL